MIQFDRYVPSNQMEIDRDCRLGCRLWSGWALELLGEMQSREGGSGGVESPDGKNLAVLYSYRNIGPFVRDTNIWIEVYIHPKEISATDDFDPKFLRLSFSDREIHDYMYGRDHDGAISWSLDSKSVWVKLPGKEITIEK